MKVDFGTNTTQAIRQWKKEVLDKYMPWVKKMNKHSTFLTKEQSEIEANENNRRREIKCIKEEHDREIIRNQERQMLEERLQAEFKMTQRS